MPSPLVWILDGGDAIHQSGHGYRKLGAVALPVMRAQVGRVVVRGRSPARRVLNLADVWSRLDVIVDQVVPESWLLDASLITAFVRTGIRLFLQKKVALVYDVTTPPVHVCETLLTSALVCRFIMCIFSRASLGKLAPHKLQLTGFSCSLL